MNPGRTGDPSSREIHDRARQLRGEMTPAEELLWRHLRNRGVANLKFRRQHPIGRFIVDFYCRAHRLIVEIDGPIHHFDTERDLTRTDYLQRRGYRVIRLQNDEVLENIDRVLESIQAACQPADPDSCDRSRGQTGA